MKTKDLTRRAFIKGTAATIGGLIGALIGLPSILYLLSPALQTEEDTDTIALGPLENYPAGVPTRFEFIRTKVNGWERTATNLDKNLSGAVAATNPIQFYGYYTLDYEKDGKVAGMLSVNSYSGQVFVHTWHGTFIEEAE